MRTRNHFCMGEGIKGFATVLAGHYPAGRVALLYEDQATGQQVASALIKNYKLHLMPYSESTLKSEDVRFVIGVGSPDILPYVRLHAGDVPFAFYATCADYRYLNPFDGSDRLSEFAYLDKEAAMTPEGVAGCYASLFSLWCECHIRKLETSYLPFCDRTREGLIKSAERVLNGDCDKEEFLPECLRVISALSSALRPEKYLYVERTSVLGLRPEEQFCSAYLLTVFMNAFTKTSFGGILNPLGEKEPIYDPSALPNQEKMKIYAKRMKAMKALPEADAEEVMRLFSAVALPELPLLFRVKNGFS